MTYWQRWISQPQTVWLRRAIFQVHMWSGIGLGLYVLVVSVTGSIVVYSNELYRAATPPPGVETKSAIGIIVVSKLLELHDDLMAGKTGRSVNGFGAVMLLVLLMTGIVVWWPGIKNWRRSLVLRKGVGWRRFIWDMHSAIGFWMLAVLVMFAVSGAYLGNPQPFQDLADRIQPPTENVSVRTVDRIIYWVAYLHFGRVNGIGIPCKGPGLCDQTVKLIWALAGLIPAFMFITGAVMWWNRVVRKI
jgi:uncharacterized iron-regulated membrane protein